MRSAPNLCNEEIVQTILLNNNGRSQRYVGRLLGVQHSTNSKLGRKYRQLGDKTGDQNKVGNGILRSQIILFYDLLPYQ